MGARRLTSPEAVPEAVPEALRVKEVPVIPVKIMRKFDHRAHRMIVAQ